MLVSPILTINPEAGLLTSRPLCICHLSLSLSPSFYISSFQPPFFQIFSANQRIKLRGILQLFPMYCREKNLKKVQRSVSEHCDFLANYQRALLLSKRSIESIRSIFKKQQWEQSLFFTSASLFRSQLTSDSLEKPMIEFPTFAIKSCETLP